MRAFRRPVPAILMMLAAGSAFAGTPPADGYRKLSGRQIRQAFVGRELTDDVHFRIQYKADGTITGHGMGRAVTRRWRIESGQLCEAELEREICYFVWKKAAAVRLLIDDSDVSTDGTLH